MRLNQRQRLQGEQLDFRFPLRGRPTRIRVLERCGQMRLTLAPANSRTRKAEFVTSPVENSPGMSEKRGVCENLQSETLDAALDLCFPPRELTEAEKIGELNRLFQSTAITPENPITDADVPF